MVSIPPIFSIRTKEHFEKIVLQVFYLQAKKNPIYKQYVKQLGIKPEQVTNVSKIPFLPIELFKTQKVTISQSSAGYRSLVFLSSGTTGINRSKHYIFDVKLYEKSFRKCFEIFYGNIKQYVILAFLPSYYENKSSSLLYMINDLMRKSKKKESRFYQKHESKILLSAVNRFLSENKKVILFGVPYALLDLAPLPKDLLYRRRKLIVIETGGMKGQREEITREELHKILCENLGVKKIHSEYGMTELLSQAYSKKNGIFHPPPWMKVFVRDVNDPFALLPQGRTGALNIIDLANIHSCSFIATQDVGRTHLNNSFEVLGRMDNSDLRGCNLLAG